MKTFATEGGYFCCEIKPSDWRREVTGIGTIQLDLLKTGVLASFYRLEGALDAAGDLLKLRRVNCFY